MPRTDPILSRLRWFLFAMVAVMALGAAGVVHLEGLSLTDAVYFSVVTVATVGYGDITPKTGVGKILAMLLILGGVGSFTGLVANATEWLVSRQARQVRRLKRNVVRGVFFAELGTELLLRCARLDPNLPQFRQKLLVDGHWKPGDFDRALTGLDSLGLAIDETALDATAFQRLLSPKGDLILRLLENPSLLEHEEFTELILAVGHLEDELSHRHDLNALSGSDRFHLSGDVKRVYLLLVRQWLPYMRHLKDNYPYLFSLAVRINPFKTDPRAEID
ncbi:MAG: potassium channel family protein [Pseudomonadota bacterium]